MADGSVVDRARDILISNLIHSVPIWRPEAEAIADSIIKQYASAIHRAANDDLLEATYWASGRLVAELRRGGNLGMTHVNLRHAFSSGCPLCAS